MMKPPWDGGPRIAERLKALGFWNDTKQRPDIMRFAREKGYAPQYLYGYIYRGVEPRGAMLKKLGIDLECSGAWLQLGDEAWTRPTTQPKRGTVRPERPRRKASGSGRH